MLILVAAALAVAEPAAPETPPPLPTDWAAAARGDIQAGYELMRDNHPGWVNPEDPGFRAQLERARQVGLEAAAKADSQPSYAASLDAFSSVLGDGHALLFATGEAPASAPPKWPGFMVAWRGDAMYVVDGEPSAGLGVGSRVIGCDGVPIAELLVKRLGGGRVRLTEQGEWWAYGTSILNDDPARLRGPAPITCDIAPATGGPPQTVSLSYRPQPDDMRRRYWTAVNGGYSEIGLTEPRPGMFVIGMPTFDNNDEAAALYKKLDAAIDDQHKALAKARAIVIDLRFNQGGSSDFPTSAAEHLWGKAAVQTRHDAAFRAVEIWWRNTPGNIAHVRKFVGMFEGRGEADLAKEYGALADRMAAGLAAGQDFTNQEPADLTKPAPAPAPVLLSRPVYVIVPGQCASACLDALDAFTAMPDVTLIGAPSAADSDYMEIREADLPSGQAVAIIPVKIWMHRPRAGGQIYRPHIEMRQADWTTDAFLAAIEADLSKRAASR